MEFSYKIVLNTRIKLIRTLKFKYSEDLPNEETTPYIFLFINYGSISRGCDISSGLSEVVKLMDTGDFSIAFEFRLLLAENYAHL